MYFLGLDSDFDADKASKYEQKKLNIDFWEAITTVLP